MAYLSASYLRVFMKNGKKHFFIDHGLAQEIDEHSGLYFENVRLVNERIKSVEAKSVKVKVSFEDQDGDEIELVARDISVLNRIFKRFPSVAKEFGLSKKELK